MRSVVKFEFISHGLDHPDYFPGCGVAFTEFDECYTGCGDTPLEAAEDALDQCMCGAGDFWPSDVQEEREEELRQFSASPDDIPENSEALYYVSIRVKYDKAGE